ncbi:Uncharacterized protein Adt_34444 [Abeliophyllum distichum]|uniref:Uncharacterized protein n=1 Tax=Abeliophyllum distichum TaxID=126358 RepID=A0ABD1R144_9LAMI
MLNYSLVLSELEPEPEFGDYNSYYLTWYDSSYGDVGPYGQQLSSSHEGPYDDYNTSINEEADDRMELSYSGGRNMLGGYESYFGGCWGEEDDVYSDKGYEAYGSNLDKEDNHYQGEEKLGSYYTSNDDMQLGYGDDQWSSYGGFSFRACGMEDFHNHDYQKLPCNNSWDDSNEIILYERIFGY